MNILTKKSDLGIGKIQESACMEREYRPIQSMALQMWSIITGFVRIYRRTALVSSCKFESDGFVQPSGDSPMDNETVGKCLFKHH